jgi:uncharacterized membrane protein YozB (DUF420 family)
LRIAVLVETALVFVQPVLAGSLLSSHYDMLVAHRYGAFATIGVAAVMGVLTWLVYRSGGPGWLPWLSAAIVLIEAGQISWGYQRMLSVHIPLGVILAAALLQLLVWSWKPRRPLPGSPHRRGVRPAAGAAPGRSGR